MHIAMKSLVFNQKGFRKSYVFESSTSDNLRQFQVATAQMAKGAEFGSIICDHIGPGF